MTHSVLHLAVVHVTDSTVKTDPHRCWPALGASPNWPLSSRPECPSAGTFVPCPVSGHSEEICCVGHVVETLDPSVVSHVDFPLAAHPIHNKHGIANNVLPCVNFLRVSRDVRASLQFFLLSKSQPCQPNVVLHGGHPAR